MKIISVNVGRPREVLWKFNVVSTAIFKEPAGGPVTVRRLNLDGDGQADLTVHGGANKAVYAYALQHYTYWRGALPGTDLPWGMFGENLTIDDFDEAEIRVGDEFVAGTARLVATQPRLPCYKLAIRFGRDDIVDRFIASGRTGVYFAVLEEGVVEAGARIERVRSDPACITIAEAAQLYLEATEDRALLARAIASQALPEGWRRRFERKLARIRGDKEVA
jgi:MOSC domain-containing protein YiiM